VSTKRTNDPPVIDDGLKSSGPGNAMARALCTARVNGDYVSQ
jgi:hypothetical protein